MCQNWMPHPSRALSANSFSDEGSSIQKAEICLLSLPLILIKFLLEKNKLETTKFISIQNKREKSLILAFQLSIEGNQWHSLSKEENH